VQRVASKLIDADLARIEVLNVSTDLSTLLGVASILIGVACTAWGVRASRRAGLPRQADLSYRIETTRLLEMPREDYYGPAVRGLSILYNAQPVSDLRRSYIALWNGGNLELDATKHLEGGTLTMTLRQAVILESQDPMSPRLLAAEPNDLKSKVAIGTSGPASLSFKFKYLRPGEGVLCEVIHSGGLSRDQGWRESPITWSEVHGDCRAPRSKGNLRFYPRPNLRGSMEEAILDRGRSIALAATATIILALISLVLPNLWALTALSAVAVVAWPSLIGLFNWFTSKPDADARELPEGLRYWPDQPEPPSPLLEAIHEYMAPRLASEWSRTASRDSERRPDDQA
jgi:hypothetical protein